MNTPIKGIFAPNIVPYNDNGQINEDELRRIIRWLGEKGVTGFYPNGSMGEFIRLSPEERKRVVTIVKEEAGDRPVLAGAAEANVDLVLDMCNYCADLGCRAVSITGPYYYKLTQDSIEQYFRDIAEKSPIDIVVYNIPTFANEISVPVLKRLALDCPRIIGTKDTSRDMSRFQRVLHEIKSQRPDFSVLIGWEELLCTAMFMGADGGTLSSAGVVPEMVMQLHQAASDGNWDLARATQYELLEIFWLMVEAPNFPEGFRAGYQLRGFETGNARFPLSNPERLQMATMCGQLANSLAGHEYISNNGQCCAGLQISRADLETIVRDILRRF
ncbi:MAG: dihydrodipicolinate synthase family protein [Opitutaceae bacterium]